MLSSASGHECSTSLRRRLSRMSRPCGPAITRSPAEFSPVSSSRSVSGSCKRAAVTPGRWMCISSYRPFLETITPRKFHSTDFYLNSSFLNSSVHLRPHGSLPPGGANKIHSPWPLNLWKISPNLPIEGHQAVQASDENWLQFQSRLFRCGMAATWVRRSRTLD
jgi:hypothetical protein